MEYVWWFAALLVGLMLGLHFGRLLTASVAYWEGISTAFQTFKAVFLFVFGTGGGAALFGSLTSPQNVVFYLIGLGIGGTVGFRVGIPSRWTIETVRAVVTLSEASKGISDIEQRSRFILAILVPPKRIVRQEGIDEQQLARDLEEGADA
jgi:hypothetical protein